MNSLPSIPSLLKKYKIFPKKHLGQHFLTAMPTIQKIVAALECDKNDLVIEIGPGLGLMTAITATHAREVIAIDRDEKLPEVAKAEFGNFQNIKWQHSDILGISVQKILDCTTCRTVKILGNLPYNISSPILFWMLDQRALISCAVIMVQKEVAMRIVAKPCNKDYGILAVLTQAYANCIKLFDVSAKSFIPPPEVTSSVVRIDFSKGDCGIKNNAQFKTIVKAAFGKRRKMLRNALISAKDPIADDIALDAALKNCKIDGKRRAETLSVEEFIKLSNAF